MKTLVGGFRVTPCLTIRRRWSRASTTIRALSSAIGPRGTRAVFGFAAHIRRSQPMAYVVRTTTIRIRTVAVVVATVHPRDAK